MFWRSLQQGAKSLMLHPLRSLLTLLGIFIGVTSVVWLLAISEGISRSAQKQIEDLGVTNIILLSRRPSNSPRSSSTSLESISSAGSDLSIRISAVSRARRKGEHTTRLNTMSRLLIS